MMGMVGQVRAALPDPSGSFSEYDRLMLLSRYAGIAASLPSSPSTFTLVSLLRRRRNRQ